MSLLRRTPRELYRVYEEEEAFDPDTGIADHDGSEASPAAEARSADRGRLVRRGLGVAALVGGVGAVAGMIAAPPQGDRGGPSGAARPSTSVPRRQAGTVFAGVSVRARPHRRPPMPLRRVERRIATHRDVPGAQASAAAPPPPPAAGTRVQTGAGVEFDFERG